MKQGTFFSFAGNDDVTMFLLQGKKLRADEWLLSQTFTKHENGYALTATPATDAALRLVESVIQANPAFDYIKVSSRIAVQLTLLGIITESDFATAIEAAGCIIMTVTILGQQRKLIIRAEYTGGLLYHVATCLNSGKTVAHSETQI